ncbi:MAG: TIR domain-containing protein [Ginsengibacter sp.]
MREKTRVFLSYNHKDNELKDKVKTALSINNELCEVFTDEKARKGDPLHKEVSRLVNHCHLIVPIITNNWLGSHETRDELVRAHERRKHIICFLYQDDSPKMDDLPFYVRESLRVHFSSTDIETKLFELRDSVFAYDEKWKLPILDDIRKLGDLIGKRKTVLPYKEKHLKEALYRAKSEISAVIDKDIFKKMVSYEDNFLTAASPYFGTANTIAAISIARISTFWTDQSAHEAVARYLHEQSGHDRKVTRLFVFDSPIDANDFKNILHANFLSYGRNGGGVFITSNLIYKQLLSQISRNHNFLSKVIDQDFGVLIYSGQDEVHLYASLNSKELYIERIEQSQFEISSLKAFLSLFKSLLGIEEGEVDEDLGVARWSSSLYKDSTSLAIMLKSLFPDLTGKMLHIVFVDANGNYEAVKECLRNLKIKFELESENLAINSIWLHERHDIRPYDGRYHGALLISREYDFAVGVEFENEDALKKYYQHPIHSVEREAVYTAIDPSLRTRFEKLSKLKTERGTESCQATIFSEIEEIIGKKIIRLDLRTDDPISDLVKRPGIPFGTRFTS